MLDLGAAPYIVTSALVARGYAVTVNGLPMPPREPRGKLELHIQGAMHQLPLALFDVERPFPLDDTTFDCVIAGEIFEHMYRQPWVMLSETWRV